MKDNEGNEIKVGDIVEVIATGQKLEVVGVFRGSITVKAECLRGYVGSQIRKSSGVPGRIDTLKDRIRELESEVENLRDALNHANGVIQKLSEGEKF